MNQLLAIIAMLSNPGPLAENSFTLQTGTTGVEGQAWDLLEYGGLPSWGLELGRPMGDRNTMTFSLHRSVTGSTLGMESYDDDGDYSETSFGAVYAGHRVGVGLEREHALAHWLLPYAGLEAQLLQGRVLLDEDLDDDDNANELSSMGFTPGAAALAGVDIPIGSEDARMRVTLNLEVGYGYALPMRLGDLGNLPIQGVQTQWGLGVRY